MNSSPIYNQSYTFLYNLTIKYITFKLNYSILNPSISPSFQHLGRHIGRPLPCFPYLNPPPDNHRPSSMVNRQFQHSIHTTLKINRRQIKIPHNIINTPAIFFTTISTDFFTRKERFNKETDREIKTTINNKGIAVPAPKKTG